MNLEIVTTEPRHLRELADNLRVQDREEVHALGMTAHEALWRSYRQAVLSRTYRIDGEIGAIFGVAGCPVGNVGKPWLLTAPPIEHAKVAMLREGRREVAEMLYTFCHLRGYVDGRYTRALRFLTALGFSLSEAFPFGPHAVPFREFQIGRPT